MSHAMKDTWRSLRRRVAFMALALVTLASCATPSIDKEYTLDETTGKGVVIGSISYTGNFAGYRLFYRQVGGEAKGFFQFGDNLIGIPMGKYDINERRLRGDVFAAALPTGDYELYGWRVDSGYSHVFPRSTVSVLFHVDAGASVYLGGFHFQKRSSSWKGQLGYSVDYKDESDRDLKIFATKYPQLTGFEIASSIEKGRVYADLGEGWSTAITIPAYVFVPRR